MVTADGVVANILTVSFGFTQFAWQVQITSNRWARYEQQGTRNYLHLTETKEKACEITRN
jgi:hypothetical protein